MKNLFKNKLFIISLIFLLLISSFSNVFAADLTVDEFQDLVQDGYKYMQDVKGIDVSQFVNYTIMNCSDGYYLLYFTDKGYAYFVNNSFRASYLYAVIYNKTSLEVSWTMNDLDGSINHNNDNCWEVGNKLNIVYSTCNLSSGFNKNIDFFPITPPEMTPTETLVEILEQEKEQVKTMQEILGILPLIIVVVVSLVGLRKALKMLETFLRRS